MFEQLLVCFTLTECGAQWTSSYLELVFVFKASLLYDWYVFIFTSQSHSFAFLLLFLWIISDVISANDGGKYFTLYYHFFQLRSSTETAWEGNVVLLYRGTY